MTEDQQREAFEAWMQNDAEEMSLDRIGQGWGPITGEYVEADTQLAWEAWQAACQWRDQAGEK